MNTERQTICSIIIMIIFFLNFSNAVEDVCGCFIWLDNVNTVYEL